MDANRLVKVESNVQNKLAAGYKKTNPTDVCCRQWGMDSKPQSIYNISTTAAWATRPNCRSICIKENPGSRHPYMWL